MRFHFAFCRLSSFATLRFFSVTLLRPFVQSVEIAARNICSGDVDFTWVIRPSTAFPVMSYLLLLSSSEGPGKKYRDRILCTVGKDTPLQK